MGLLKKPAPATPATSTASAPVTGTATKPVYELEMVLNEGAKDTDPFWGHITAGGITVKIRTGDEVEGPYGPQTPLFGSLGGENWTEIGNISVKRFRDQSKEEQAWNMDLEGKKPALYGGFINLKPLGSDFKARVAGWLRKGKKTGKAVLFFSKDNRPTKKTA